MGLERRALVAAIAAALALAIPFGSVAASRAEHRSVQMLDACDGPSFDAAIGAGSCQRNGGVTFQQFIADLMSRGQAPAWRFSPTHLKLATAGQIDAYNKGGEFHTFTEVGSFGGGCVPELNAVLDLSPVPECGIPGIFATGAAPGGEVETGELSAGTHRFQCLIHPWMRATVEVG
jgi:hypothetical protein